MSSESEGEAEKHEALRIGMIGIAAGMKCLANITQGLYREQEPFSTDGNWSDGGWQIAWTVEAATLMQGGPEKLRIWGTAPLGRRVEWTRDNDEDRIEDQNKVDESVADEWVGYDVAYQIAQFLIRELGATSAELDQNTGNNEQWFEIGNFLRAPLNLWYAKYRKEPEQ
jgi:hypothetical protein